MRDIYAAPQSELYRPSLSAEHGSMARALSGEYDCNVGEIISEAWTKTSGAKGTISLALFFYILVVGPLAAAVAWGLTLLSAFFGEGLAKNGFLGQVGIGFWLVLSFLLEWSYPVLFEVYAKGQTPRKKAMGLVVVNDGLSPVTWSVALVRILLRAADFFPFMYLGGIICMVCGTGFRRMGDWAAGPLVVYKVEKKPALPLPARRPRPAPIPLSLDDQMAMIDFTQRPRPASGKGFPNSTNNCATTWPWPSTGDIAITW